MKLHEFDNYQTLKDHILTQHKDIAREISKNEYDLLALRRKHFLVHATGVTDHTH